ncbi:MAG: type I-G CRISPR-associated helicase/endonuclease Cas3g, partial [Vulcanimicrobiaceae bacterium]
MKSISPTAWKGNEGTFDFSFVEAFECLTGNRPYDWQIRLFENLRAADLPRLLDIPTGIGKTSIIPIWLLARAAGANIPRRLVYVVDRRTIVDQATQVAESLQRRLGTDAQGIGLSLRSKLAIGEGQSLAVSTLRGQLADNRAWLEDPTRAAIIVGTIDMIGSRLLFQGYAVSRRMRPYHAGLLGADSIIVLDEAHISPAFGALLASIADDSAHLRAPAPVPQLATLSLSATTTTSSGDATFRLTEAEAQEPAIARRLKAGKLLRRYPIEKNDFRHELAQHAISLGAANSRVLVYCNSREDAAAVAGEIEKKYKGHVELLVGARRVLERDALAQSAVYSRFTSAVSSEESPAFIVATSAGEVGVDLDADHLVCDLVPFERMVQRLGRVNRSGRPDPAYVDLLVTNESEEEKKETELATILRSCDDLLYKLSKVDDGCDASPAALRV